jgi:hypothetical protein
MREARVLAANGMLGTGFFEASFARALERQPHVIGADSGSTDPGPYLLGAAKPYQSPLAYKRDLRHMLKAGVRHGIPVIVGSAGGAGTDAHVDLLRDLALAIAAEEGLRFRLALIRSEPNRAYLKRLLAEGRIRPLDPAPELTPDLLDRCVRIVGMMGAEPIMQALREGAQVVICGRSSDTSVFAAVPLMMGLPPGPVWHAAKILECGVAAAEQRIAPDCMMGFIRDDHFIIWPPSEAVRCTPLSVAAHTLYENASPFHLYEPSGMLDTTAARYEPWEDRGVRVSGSRFVAAERYTVKLEGAELAGYHAFSLSGIRDPIIVEQLDRFLADVRERAAKRLGEALGSALDGVSFWVNFRVYGKDGVMGALEPLRDRVGHEVGLLIEAVAPTQELATAICGIYEYIALHRSVPQWRGQLTNLAFPFAPSVIERGPVYRFALHHVVEVDDPLELFRIEHLAVG